ncbi:hypothetical protein BCR42DRAFT_450566 [Absidia repens]|uniref:Uncharacterized protein n=1 Tax=Absidia repens TaxID=90262 RepID=A0A1X2IKK7_9FUNG|nr:hypothetical protein BCR42DRAFT_450566 [Absidia repens]
MADGVMNELKGIAEEEQVMKLRFQRQTLKAATQVLKRQVSKYIILVCKCIYYKRKSKRIESARIAKKRKADTVQKLRDNIRIHGLQGTLGSNFWQLGLEITQKDSKSSYFSRLSQNGIVDMTNFSPGSQIQQTYAIRTWEKIVNLSKMTSKQSVKAVINALENYKTKDNLQRATKATMYHMGDTISSQSADIGTIARLDIRIIIRDNHARIVKRCYRVLDNMHQYINQNLLNYLLLNMATSTFIHLHILQN